MMNSAKSRKKIIGLTATVCAALIAVFSLAYFTDIVGNTDDPMNIGIAEKNIEIVQELKAPVEKGQKIGTYSVSLEGKTIAEIPIVSTEQIDKLSTADIYKNLLESMFMRSNEEVN